MAAAPMRAGMPVARPPTHAAAPMNPFASSTASAAMRAPQQVFPMDEFASELDMNFGLSSGPVGDFASYGSGFHGAGGEGDVSLTEAAVQCTRALRNQKGRAGMTLSQLQTATGLPSSVIRDPSLSLSLQSSAVIGYDALTERFTYKAQYPAEDIHGLLRLLKQTPQGLHLKDLEDSYPGVEADLDTVTRSGGALALAQDTGMQITGSSGKAGAAHHRQYMPMGHSAEGGLYRIRNKDRQQGDMVWWRGPFIPSIDVNVSPFSQLSGTIKLTPGSMIAVTTEDLTQELFRNDVILLAGKTFRVSSDALTYANVRRTVAAERKRARARAAEEAAGKQTSAGQPPVKKPRFEEDTAGGSKTDDPAPGTTAGDLGPEGDDSGSEADIDLEDADLDFEKQEANIGRMGGAEGGAAYPATGIYVVSVGNDVKRTGGAFSVADTAPHRLPSTARGYTQPFTATSLPLDRPWDGPEMSGVIGYKFGCTGDLRTLWRLMAVKDPWDIAAATGFSDARDTSAVEEKEKGAPGVDGKGDGKGMGGEGRTGARTTPHASHDDMKASLGDEGILPKLGGANALKHLPTFPEDHRDLQTAMRKDGIPPAKSSAPPQTTAETLTKKEKDRRRRMFRVRKPHKASLTMNLGEHLEGTADAKAALRANLIIQLQNYELAKRAAYQRLIQDRRDSAATVVQIGGGGAARSR